MWCGIKVSASYLWASSAIFVIKPKHDWQSRKNTVTQQNICYNKYWENCDVIIFLARIARGKTVCRLRMCQQRPSRKVTFSAFHNSSNISCSFCICVSLFICRFKSRQYLGSWCLCRHQLIFVLPRVEWEATREKDKEKWNCQTEQRHPPQTVDRLRVRIFFYLLSFSGCPLSPSSALLSPSASLWILACREVSVMAHHNMTLGNIDCSFQLSSWVTLSGTASFSWPGAGAVSADSTLI